MRHTRPTTLLAAVLLAAGALGCDGDPGGQAGGEPAVDGADDAAVGGETDGDQEPDVDTLVADVVGADGTEHGRVTFTEADGGVLVEAILEGFDGAGFHGFHLHEQGVCEPGAPEGPFDSAGGHLGGDGADHGEHAGDLTALQVADDGRAVLTVRTTALTLGELAAADAALIVHADPDNLGNIPPRYVSEDTEGPGPDDETLDTGDAGDRLACGVLLAP